MKAGHWPEKSGVRTAAGCKDQSHHGPDGPLCRGLLAYLPLRGYDFHREFVVRMQSVEPLDNGGKAEGCRAIGALIGGEPAVRALVEGKPGPVRRILGPDIKYGAGVRGKLDVKTVSDAIISDKNVLYLDGHPYESPGCVKLIRDIVPFYCHF